MKILKSTLLSFVIAASMGAVSTSVFAEADAGRISYKPVEAIDLVAKDVQAAINGITSGSSDAETSAKLIKVALDHSKEINANDKVDNKRSKANKLLKAAIENVKKGATQEAEQELRDAEKAFLGLKELL